MLEAEWGSWVGKREADDVSSERRGLRMCEAGTLKGALAGRLDGEDIVWH